jgi:(p)ppGpp synthase/HD superfamily hydrolase
MTTGSFASDTQSIGQVLRGAKLIAQLSHGAIDQRRKYTGEPYIVHPAAVAHAFAQKWPDDWVGQAASWLHDVLEDTPNPEEKAKWIERVCGEKVLKVVKECTDPATAKDGNREARFKINLSHIQSGGLTCHRLKWCDALDNLKSLEVYAPEFALVWIEEKRQMAQQLHHLDGSDRIFLLETLEQAKGRIETIPFERWLAQRAPFNGRCRR